MRSGRPPSGADDHLRGLDGPAEAKERLRAVLEVMAGEVSVGAACERLGVSESRFHELRRRALQSAVEGLTPSAAGRPRKAQAVSRRERELEEKLDDLEADLQAALIRTELALVLPKVLKPWPAKSRKKNG